MGGSYSSASLENGTWTFSGLSLEGSKSLLPQSGGYTFSASAKNCNVTVTAFNRLNVFPPMGYGTLEYQVSGVGVQMFNLYYSDNRWLSYSIYVDGVPKAEGNFWNVTEDGWLTVSGSSNVKIVYGARDSAVFTSMDQFVILSHNSSIGFEGTGNYVFADFKNGSWAFQNIALNGVVPQGAPRWALGASAENCNVTITCFLAPFGTMGNGWINYTVVGTGTQTFNGNLDGQANFPLNFSVYIDGEQKPQNNGWVVSEDGWLTITGATQNVSIASLQVIPDWFWNLPNPSVQIVSPSPSPSEPVGEQPAISPPESSSLTASPVPEFLPQTNLILTVALLLFLIAVAVAVVILENQTKQQATT